MSATDLLIQKVGDEYSLNPVMVDLIRTISNKYRIYLLTKVTGDSDENRKLEKEKVFKLL